MQPEQTQPPAVLTMTSGPETCPTTQAPVPRFIPPEPYPERPAPGYFWYGTAGLWTELPEDGRWEALPHDPQTGFSQKIVFWNEAYNWRAEPKPALTLEGRRLDGDAPPINAAQATNAYHDDYGSFMIAGGGIPTAGCWEFTGRYDEAVLSFVVWVEE